jgi:WD40 repeat protein/beta-lactamase regulating signal transducer with metallopeptidase domain
MTTIELLNVWGAVWAGFVTRALVDATIVLALVLLVWLPFRKRMSAQLAHGLFCLVLLKLIVPVPVTWPTWMPSVSVRQAAEQVASWTRVADQPELALEAIEAEVPPPLELPTTGDLRPSQSDAPVPEPFAVSTAAVAPGGSIEGGPLGERIAVVRPPARLSTAAILMIGWATLALLLLARFIRALVGTRRLIRDAIPLGDDWLPIDVEALRRSAGIRREIGWAVSPKLHSPAVGGLVRPTVVIPPDLDDGLTPKQLTWVLLHELAHVRRGDLWVTVVQRIVQAFFFFHPAVHVANWIIDQLREYACDDVALAACKSSRHDCGEGFLTIVGRSVERPLTTSPALGLFESRMLIRRRLMRILDKRRKVHERLSPGAAIGLLSVAFLVLPHGRSHDATANIPSALEPSGWARSGESTDEPLSYRPGKLWVRNAGSDANASGRRVAVLALAYSPDGDLLATACDDGSVVLRDVATGQVLRRLAGHRDAACCLAFSPNGRLLATGGYDKTVRLWDVASGTSVAQLRGHTNWVHSVAFSRTGDLLASAGHDKTVRLWSAKTGEELNTLAGHSAAVWSVAFAPDDDLLASGGADGVAVVWDLSTGKPRVRLDGHHGTIRALDFGNQGEWLATAGEDGEARIWDLDSGRARAVLSGHTDMVLCLAFSPQGGTLMTGSLDTTVKLWDTATGRERASLQAHRDGVSALALAPRARQLASASFDGSVQLWEPTAPIFSPAACLTYPDEARAVAFAPDGHTVIAAGKAGIARWNARTGAPVAKTLKGDETALAVTPDGRTYATGSPDGTVRMLDYATDRELASFDGHRGVVTSLAFSPDGQTLISGGSDGSVRRYDLPTRRPVGLLLAQAVPVTSVRFSNDGRKLAAATGDASSKLAGEVMLWDVPTWTLRVTLRGQSVGIASVAFAPDGRTLATAGWDGVITVRDSVSGAVHHAQKYTECRSITFSPDGHVLATAHKDGDVVLWDASTGRQIGMLKGHQQPVVEVVFSPTGRSLATAGEDGSVKIWGLGARRQTARLTLSGDMNLLCSVAYSPDGKTIAVGDGAQNTAGNVILWDVATRKVKATLEGHELAVHTVVFSPDGTLIASGSADGTIRVWDTATGSERYALTGLSGVTELVFSPDGKLLAAAGETNGVTLWEVETGTEAARLTDLAGPAQSVAFSPDGRLLATGGGVTDGASKARGEVKLWDVASRTLVATLEGHTCGVLAVAFSPDGETLASGGMDQSVRLWNVSTHESRLVLNGLPNCVRALAFAPDGRTVAWSGRNDGLVSLHDTQTGAEVARLVGHSRVVLSIAFAPNGSGLATAGADKTIKFWEMPTAGSSLTAKH